MDAPADETKWKQIGDMGWDGNTTMGDIIRAQDAGEVSSHQLVHS
ncbi:MAG: hypothetical protein ACRDQ5_17335 [Sciscionella sp.]